MATAQSILPFDGFTHDGTSYGAGQTTTGKFVQGSGQMTATPVLAQTPTDDGVLQRDVLCKTLAGRWEMYGDYTSLATSGREQTQLIPSWEGGSGTAGDMFTAYGVVTASYNHRTGRTSCEFSGKDVGTDEPLEEGAAIKNTTGGDLAA